jgi:hypothetical protein
MNREKELKLKKVLAYHLQRGIITKKKYKKELEYIKLIKQDENKRHQS